VLGCFFCNPVVEFALEDILETKPGSWSYGALDFWLTGGLAASWLAFSAWLFLRAVRRDPAVDTGVDETSGRWHLVTFVCFVMMSFLLIALANPRGDVQDNFIQKVKFISSHGIYSLWIGYGLALALWWGRGWVRRAAPEIAAPLVALALAAVLATPLLPVNENYHNFRLVNETSAADQNGHDFGWQFGNYQLRGAPAITEELSEDEEPLPDPTFPRPMTENAVFFGGTDPGRFVPTYMIYSAMVRPDVYLITQNALADSTYLDTMRGISREGEGVQGVYSDQIWMPTIEDNRRAFQRYTDDVQAGRRPDIGGITRTPDGRVSVNGAIAVMQINAIIAEDIFLKNRDKHEFYVEESYPMEWMYRYITPNGLIMKVNHDEFWKEGARPVPYPAAVANADMDFWDWYTRRLVNDPKYGRDMPARKAFNKLRSAIAGTYVQRGDRVRAERAYNQAHALYVLSPETLRGLVLNIDLALNRTGLPLRRLGQLLALDPNNDGVRSMSNEVARIAGAMEDLRVLGPIVGYTPERATPEQRLRLLSSALALGHPDVAARAIVGPNGESALGPKDLFRAGVLFADAGQREAASKAFARVPDALLASDAVATADVLKAYEAHVAAKDYPAAFRTLAAYLPRNRTDWRKWIEYAALATAMERPAAARAAVQNALAAGGDEARAAMRRNPALAPLLPAAPAGSGPLLPGRP
jgi:tetratricopeptide (TPR) repeat protein